MGNKVSFPDIDTIFDNLPKGAGDKIKGTNGSAMKKTATKKKGAVKGTKKKK